MSVAVIGAGAFGTALAISLSGNDPVRLWTRSSKHADSMRRERMNAAHLPGILLPKSVEVSSDMARATQQDVLLVAVPMQDLRTVLQAHGQEFRNKTLVACCKGMELKTGIGPVSVIEEALPDVRAALLTGPSFAADIARGLPTALTLACKSETQSVSLQKLLTTANLRLYRTTDTIGAELGGALKNVIAIGCGAVIGAGLGDSARAALMTRGYAEMQRIATALQARPETLAGLSGFGDLALTCTSDLSRNYQLGLAIGRAKKFERGITVEGSATARAVKELAARKGIDMPITNTVVALLDGEFTITDAMASLLARPLREE